MCRHSGHEKSRPRVGPADDAVLLRGSERIAGDCDSEGDALHPSVSMVRPEAGMKKADPVGSALLAHTLDAGSAYC